MKITLLIPLFFLALSPTELCAQDSPEPLADGVVARLNGDDIKLADYHDYLFQRFGKRGVKEMVANMLVEEAAKGYGITVDPAELDAKTAEREAGTRKGQTEEAFLENLHRNGQSYAMYRAELISELRSELLLRDMVLITRIATDDKIQAYFERQYGLGGVKMRVRHILVMPNILRANLVRGGTKPADIDMAVIKDQARQIAVDARARLAGGEEFSLISAELSHDRVTKDLGGELKNYNGRLYGPAFRGALDSLEIGQLSEVLESGAGFHVIELLERSVTRIEDVQDQIATEVLKAEPTYQEISGLRNSLLESAELKLW